jgi:hypothetical protein
MHNSTQNRGALVDERAGAIGGVEPAQAQGDPERHLQLGNGPWSSLFAQGRYIGGGGLLDRTLAESTIPFAAANYTGTLITAATIDDNHVASTVEPPKTKPQNPKTPNALRMKCKNFRYELG